MVWGFWAVKHESRSGFTKRSSEPSMTDQKPLQIAMSLKSRFYRRKLTWPTRRWRSTPVSLQLESADASVAPGMMRVSEDEIEEKKFRS
jgi:hypothetical protein